jgi:hypothetical protein
MAKKIVNVNSHPLTWENVNDAVSDINDNFDELYSGVPVSASIIPDADVTYDLGSSDFRFRDLYLSGSTINLGGAVISANADGSVNVPGGLETGFSLIGFAQENNVGGPTIVSANGKTFAIPNPINPGWTLGVHIVTDADHLYPNLVRPQCSFVEDGSGNIISVTVTSPGVNYPATEYGGVFEDPINGELTTDLGFTKFGPDDGEQFTITGLGNAFGYQFSSLDHLYTYTEFTVDTQSQTVTGTATAQGTFDGVLYELTFGLKFRDMNDPGNEYGLIVDPAVSSITIDGLLTTTAGHLRRAYTTGNNLYLQADNDGNWSLTNISDGLANQTDFSMIFDKALTLGQLFYPLWAPQTSVQAIGNSSVNGDLSVTGNLTLAQTMTLNPGTEPLNPVEGTVAVANGVAWDPAGDGTKQLVLFLNSGWNLVTLTPVTP